MRNLTTERPLSVAAVEGPLLLDFDRGTIAMFAQRPFVGDVGL